MFFGGLMKLIWSRSKSKSSKSGSQKSASEAEAMTQFTNEDTSSASSEVAPDERFCEETQIHRGAQILPENLRKRSLSSRDPFYGMSRPPTFAHITHHKG
uniref:Uncharacterized protein n=1 Tax=Steinernema glaseri TaxID=37863 RepID=A0A1I7YPH8_9BILA